MLQNYMPVIYHDMSMNMSFGKNEIARMYVFRKTANFRGAFVYRNGPKWAKIIEMDYQNRPQYVCILYKDRVAFNSYS